MNLQQFDPMPMPAPAPQIAGFWRRLLAFALDSAFLGIPALVLGLAFFSQAEALGQSGRLVGFAAALLYFGFLDSRVGDGQTLGKQLLKIRVVSETGETISAVRSMARFLVLGIPGLFNGLLIAPGTIPPGLPTYLLGGVFILLVFGIPGANAYLFVFNRRTRQSLQDLTARTLVVRQTSPAIPISAFTPRLHKAAIACWFVLLLAVSVALPLAVDKSGVPVTMDLRSAIASQAGVTPIAITKVTTSIWSARAGANTSSYFFVSAQPNDYQRDSAEAASAIAAVVLDQQPDLLGAPLLIVQIMHRFDLGVASWSRSEQVALDANGWRARLKTQRPAPTSL